MKCPICGKENTLSVCLLTQNSREYRIKSDGTKTKKPVSVQKDLYMDEGYILICKNGCEVNDLAWEFVDDKLVVYEDARYPSKRI